MTDLASLVRALPLQVEAFAIGGLLCGVIIAIFLIFILVAVWVYRDAESRGMSGVLWLLVVLVAGIIGLIIYLVVRGGHPVRPVGYGAPYPGYPPTYPPTYPQAPVQPGAPPPPAAPPGQAQAAPSVAYCRNCGAPLQPGMSFCTRCGARVG